MPATGSVPSPPPHNLYKILTPANVPTDLHSSLSAHDSGNPATVEAGTILPRTPLDDSDGFVHLSTASQVPYVLSKFYSSATPSTEKVLLFKLDYAKLADGEDLRWEPAGKDGSVFAHVYGGDVKWKHVLGWLEVERGSEGWNNVLSGMVEEGWLR